jgi:hypothetical protein
MRVLSYGGGVNSTAILGLIKLGKVKMPDRIIFCDTGVERPETYCYLKHIQKEFPQIEIVKNKKWKDLLEYCNKYKVIPARMTRWCTIDFKIKPFQEAVGCDHIKILGIDAGEQHRIRDLSCEYPLVELGINRNGCRDIIKKIGWEIPIRSGCFICPNMGKKDIYELSQKHKDLYDILVALEKQANDRNPKIFFRVPGKLIPEYIGDKEQIEIDGFENYQHCLCKYD